MQIISIERILNSAPEVTGEQGIDEQMLLQSAVNEHDEQQSTEFEYVPIMQTDANKSVRDVDHSLDRSELLDDSIADPDYEPCSMSDTDTDDSISDNVISGMETVAEAAAESARKCPVSHRDDNSISDNDISGMETVDEAAAGSARKCPVSHRDDSISDNDISGMETVAEAAVGSAIKSKVVLSQKRERKRGCKEVYDKTHHCVFCGLQILSKISRHLINVHSDETVIREIILLPKRSSERRAKLQKLANEGNFKHNINVLQEGRGELVVGKRGTNKSASEYTACEFCKRFESKTNLWRHMKSCAARKEYYEGSNIEPEKNQNTPTFR